MTSPRHAFLSYCHDDKLMVRALRHELTEGGLNVWWDDEILPGQDWKYEVRNAMANAYAVVVCLSRHLATREQSGVFPELRDAIGVLKTMQPGAIFVIPVRLCDCPVPSIELDSNRTLDNLQRVDLFPDSERQQQMAKLIHVLREKAGTNNSTGTPLVTIKKSRVIITVDLDYDNFDKRSENTLRHGLANFLDVDATEISIIETKEGSVKITIELPEHAARRLLLLRNEPGLTVALKDFPITSIEDVEQQLTKTGITAHIANYQVGMDGKWGLETMAHFSRLYSQVYALVHAVNVAHQGTLGSVTRTFQSYPWRGGFSRLNFYQSLKSLIPLQQRPDIRSIQFASPGTMVLNLVPEVADHIRTATLSLLDPEGHAYDVYKSIDSDMADMGLKKTHVQGRSEDDEGKIDIRELTDSQLAFVQQALSDLAKEINFTGVERLSQLTGNRLAALKILMSYFRRIRDLVRLVRQDLIKL